MSLLSSTQGTPERVWSLVAAIAANGGSLGRSDAERWLNPGFMKEGQRVAEKPTAFAQALNAATSLGAVTAVEGSLHVASACGSTAFRGFCDWTHDRLVALDSQSKDAVVLEGYSWLAVEAARQGEIGWFHEATADELADAAEKALPEGFDDDGDRRINKTKLAPWRRWLEALGLFARLPTRSPSHPSPDARVAREIERSDLPRGVEVPAREFLAALAARLPYLDGGRMFGEAAGRMGCNLAERPLSPLYSAALRNLDDDGVLALRLSGDATGVMRLSPETHRFKAFHAVVLPERADA